MQFNGNSSVQALSGLSKWIGNEGRSRVLILASISLERRMGLVRGNNTK